MRSLTSIRHGDLTTDIVLLQRTRSQQSPAQLFVDLSDVEADDSANTAGRGASIRES